ncbi:MAG: flagellar cap protein FliD N-terminal domain-containing protein, partial [Planctomycetota bacterium]
MSGITSGIGLVSGIDTASLIQQLLAVESRPQQLAQVRLAQLQSQQAAFLDINTRLGGLQSAARSFRTENTFSSASATSSDEDV